MRVEVGTVRRISVAALFSASLLCVCAMMGRSVAFQAGWSQVDEIAHVIGCYGLTLLSFAAFPSRRRTDLVKAVIVGAILLEVAQPVLGRPFSLLHLGLDVLGAYAVLVSSFMERFRSLTRVDPHEPFSLVYPNDRRRPSPRLRTSSQAQGTAKAQSRPQSSARLASLTE